MSSRNGKKATGLAALEGLGSLADLDAMGSGLDGLKDLEGAGGDDAPVVDHLAGVDYDNATNEVAMQQETSAVLAAFQKRAKAEQERFKLATDSEYWVGVCFQSRSQKEFFLAAIDMLQRGDKYIDGQLLAKRMGVALPKVDVPYNVSAKVDAKYAAMVGDAG